MDKPYWKMNLAMLWFSQLLVLAGYAAMIPFIPLFLKNELHLADRAELAFFVSMFNTLGTLGYTLFCPIWGWLSDKYGVKLMLLRGTFGTAFIFPLMGYVSSPWMLVFLRFLTACCAGTTAASQIMIARTTPDNRQGFALGVLTTSIWGGSMLGNVVGGFIIHYYSYLHAFWFCGILYFLAGFSILFTKDGDMKKSKATVLAPARSGWRKLVPDFSLALWIMFALFLVNGFIRNFEIPFVALRIDEMCPKGEAEYWTGIISAVVCCGAILSGPVFGALADRMSPKMLLVPAFTVSAVALVLQGAGNSLGMFGGSRTLLYLAAGGIQPLLQKVLSTITPKEKRGGAFGFSTCTQGVGTMLAAMVGGWCMVQLSLSGVFYCAGILYIIALPIFVHYIGRLMSGSVEARGRL